MSEEKVNPKMKGSACIDCRVQIGVCPNNCNQCFYNRPGAFYCDINQPQLPDPADVNAKGLIVRMNSGHDSNLDREVVIEQAQKYNQFFFNTSIPNFDFPGPVVFTANGLEEEPAWCPIVDRKYKTRLIHPKQDQFIDRLMFVRLRVSLTNLDLIEYAVAAWTAMNVPVVLTFMAYYSQTPPGTYVGVGDEEIKFWSSSVGSIIPAYRWRKRILNSYWCATPEFQKYVVQRMQKIGGTMVTMCGTYQGDKCNGCRNCETYYIQRAKYLIEKGT